MGDDDTIINTELQKNNRCLLKLEFSISSDMLISMIYHVMCIVSSGIVLHPRIEFMFLQRLLFVVQM